MSHLPNHAASTPAAPSSTEDDVRASEGAPDTDASASPTVLVVDDTAGNRYAVSRILRGAGMHVIEADNGRDALRLMESAPDLVVLDIRLPDITGYELCRLIKTNPATAFTPVMHVSASYTADADRAYGLEAGADAYLTHPVDPGLLLATTRALLRASRAEAGFRRAAREWRTTFDAISDPIFLIDGRGVVRRCNRAAAELAHRNPKEVIGRTWDQVRADVGLAHHAELSTIAEGHPIRNVEVVLGDRCFSVSTGRAESESGADVLVACVWSDVTAREAANRERDALLERTERALRDTEVARLEAESANRAKSDFLAVMSHELRTPLNAIAGFTELIMLGIRGPVTPEQTTDLEKIRRSQVTLLALINDVLSFAKIESSSVHYDIQDILVNDALTAAAEFVEVQLRTKGVRFVHRRCASEIIVRADPDKLQQILLNLLSNAVKFTPPAGTVTLSCERDGHHVLLRVSDTGHGIAEDRRETIFDPFVQVDQRLVREHHGVGLGLAISRSLARGMAGDLSVASVVGAGSTFTLRLPTP